MFLFTFKFITHMKLIFVCGVRKGSGFILFSFRYLVIPSSFNKKTFISPTVLDYLLYHKSYQSMRESVLAILILFQESVYLRQIHTVTTDIASQILIFGRTNPLSSLLFLKSGMNILGIFLFLCKI